MHNYLKKIEELKSEGKCPSEPRKFYDAKVAHDSWCHVYRSGECNCDPEITVVEITNQNRAEVADLIVKGTAEFRKRMKEKDL